jgi:HEAT repeat protein/DNA-binding HxlR family transcriptional regulator
MAGTEKNKQQAEVYDALSHPLRIAILKSLNEGPMGFAELKRSVNVDSSGHLKHHLDKLDVLIKTDEHGKYCLSDKGKEALLTLQPIERYSEDARFREQVGLLIRSLRSKSESVQEIAIVQLSLFGPRAVPFLKSALSEAIAELNSLEESEGQSRWYSGSDASDAAERAVVGLTRALGIISVPGTATEIAQALPRTEALEALAKIGNKQALDVIVSSIHGWFAKNVEGGHYREEEEELKETTKVDNFLRKIFNSFDEEGRRALETALTNESFEHRHVIARTLAVVGDDRSVPALTIALENGDFLTMTEAANALRRLKATEAIPKIIEVLLKTESFLSAPRDRNSNDWNLRQEAESAWTALANAALQLGSVDDWITIAFHRPKDERYARLFYDALISSKDKAVPGLTKLLQAPDNDVQRTAAEMIAKIKRGEKADARSYY